MRVRAFVVSDTWNRWRTSSIVSMLNSHVTPSGVDLRASGSYANASVREEDQLNATSTRDSNVSGQQQQQQHHQHRQCRFHTARWSQATLRDPARSSTVVLGACV